MQKSCNGFYRSYKVVGKVVILKQTFQRLHFPHVLKCEARKALCGNGCLIFDYTWYYQEIISRNLLLVNVFWFYVYISTISSDR